MEAAAEIPEGKADDRRARRGTETSPQARHQPRQANANTVHHTSDNSQLHRARGVCSVQKGREAARGTPADRPTRQCQLLVSEVADDPGYPILSLDAAQRSAT